MPISSPQMMTMLGFLPLPWPLAVWAAAGVMASGEDSPADAASALPASSSLRRFTPPARGDRSVLSFNSWLIFVSLKSSAADVGKRPSALMWKEENAAA